MSKFNLLIFSIEDKQTIFYGIQELLCGVPEMNKYMNCETVPVDLKELIFHHLKEKLNISKKNQMMKRKLGPCVPVE